MALVEQQGIRYWREWFEICMQSIGHGVRIGQNGRMVGTLSSIKQVGRQCNLLGEEALTPLQSCELLASTSYERYIHKKLQTCA